MKWTLRIERGCAGIYDEQGIPICQTGTHGHLAPSDEHMEQIVRDHNRAEIMADVLHALAMLALQSDRYTNDVDYREATDNALALVQGKPSRYAEEFEAMREALEYLHTCVNIGGCRSIEPGSPAMQKVDAALALAKGE